MEEDNNTTGVFYYDKDIRKVVSPQGERMTLREIVDTLNYLLVSHAMMLDIYNAITQVLSVEGDTSDGIEG